MTLATRVDSLAAAIGSDVGDVEQALTLTHMAWGPDNSSKVVSREIQGSTTSRTCLFVFVNGAPDITADPDDATNGRINWTYAFNRAISIYFDGLRLKGYYKTGQHLIDDKKLYVVLRDSPDADPAGVTDANYELLSLKGDTGAQGPTGNDGVAGPAGADGSDGAPGADGAPGGSSTLFRGAFHSSNETGGITAGDLMALDNNVNVSAAAVENSTGVWTVTLSSAVPSVNHSVIASVSRAFDASEPAGQAYARLTSTTTVEVKTYTGNGASLAGRDFVIECMG